MDFTYKIYKQLLNVLVKKGYEFQTFRDFIQAPKSKVILLRHDVDDRKLHSLAFAKIQHELNIKGTYYFRMVPESFDPIVIKQIEDMGHEIGYHYEDMDFANGDKDKALEYFEKHLKALREVAKIDTLCMHGSPKSKYDNKDIWQKYDYKSYDLIAEPYFDVDFNQIAYYTDTGRMWDGYKVSVRDKVNSKTNFPVFHSTSQIIKGIEKDIFPQQVMFNFHPQRWTDDKALWYKEALIQQLKNAVKRIIVLKQ